MSNTPWTTSSSRWPWVCKIARFFFTYTSLCWESPSVFQGTSPHIPPARTGTLLSIKTKIYWRRGFVSWQTQESEFPWRMSFAFSLLDFHLSELWMLTIDSTHCSQSLQCESWITNGCWTRILVLVFRGLCETKLLTLAHNKWAHQKSPIGERERHPHFPFSALDYFGMRISVMILGQRPIFQ